MTQAEHPNHEAEKQRQATELAAILDAHADKRVVVLGTTCTGKSTLISRIPGALDMDALVFPRLTAEESAYVNQSPWTPEIGATMTRLTKERVQIEPGSPVFGTVLLDADVVVRLDISDGLLTERTAARGVDFTNAKNMQTHIQNEIAESGLPVIAFAIG